MPIMERVLTILFSFIICVQAFTEHIHCPVKRDYTTLQNALQTSASSEAQIPAITERILDLTQKEDIAIVIDVENVRGKTSFELDHCDLLDRLVIWTSLRQNAYGRTLAVVDHGSKSSAHLLHNDYNATNDTALCVSFAGPLVKADDIIARDVRWLLSSTAAQHIVVITADQELSWRCRSATRSADSKQLNSIMRKLTSFDTGTALRGGRGKRGKGGRKKSRAARKKQYLQLHQESEESEDENVDNDNEEDSNHNSDGDEDETLSDLGPTVEIIAPQRFLEDLEQALREWLDKQEYSRPLEEEIDVGDIPIPTPITTMQTLFKKCGEILSIESTLRKKCSLRKRHTQTEDLRVLKTEWKELLLTLRTSRTEKDNSQQYDSLPSSLAWSLSSFTSQEDLGDESNSILTAPLPSSSSMSETPWEELSPDEQEKLLKRWGKRRGRHGTKREKTEDRIVLAERLRRQLELVETPTICKDKDEKKSLAKAYGDYINSAIDL